MPISYSKLLKIFAEKEIDTARALFEIMTLIHTGSYSFEKNEITFESVKNAFWRYGILGEKRRARGHNQRADRPSGGGYIICAQQDRTLYPR